VISKKTISHSVRVLFLVTTTAAILSASVSADNQTGKLNSILSSLLTGPERAISLTGGLRGSPLTVDLVAVGPARSGDIAAVRFRASLTSSLDRNFRMIATGSIVGDEERQTIRIDRIDGFVGQGSIVLEEPFSIIRFQGRLHVGHFRLHIAEGIMSGEGSVQDNSAMMKITWERIPAYVLAVAGGPRLGGVIQGELLLTGSSRNPQLMLSLSLAKALDCSMLPAKTGDDLAASVKATFKGRVMNMSLLLAGDGPERFEADLSLPLSLSLIPWRIALLPSGKLQGRIRGTIPLHALPALLSLEHHVMQGRMQIDIRVAGTVTDPQMAGGATISDGYYEYIRSGTILDSIQGNLRARGSTVYVDELTATEPSGGSIHAEGGINLAPVRRPACDLTVALNHATVVRKDYLEASATGSLHVTGTTEQANLSGELTIPTVVVRLPSPLPVEAQPLPAVELGQAASRLAEREVERPAPWFPVSSDLRLTIPGGFVLRGRGFASEWKGYLHISGPVHGSRVDGRLSLVKGHLDFFEESFAITHGTIGYSGPEAVLPQAAQVNIVAEKRYADFRARLEVVGTAASSTVLLESIPARSEPEILSQILFNRPAALVTAAQAIRLGLALNILDEKELSVLEFMHRIGRELRLERLELLQPETEPEEFTATRKAYVQENIYVEVKEDPSGQPGQVTVEIELTPSISLESEAGTDAEGGVGIIYKCHY